MRFGSSARFPTRSRLRHFYFTLKDEKSQMLRSCSAKSGRRCATPKTGMEVLCSDGELFYTAHGDLQLYVGKHGAARLA